MAIMSDTVDNHQVFAGARRIAALVAVVGFAIWGFTAMGAGQARTNAMQGYLLGYLYWVVLTLGSLSLLLLQHIISARWGLMIRRLLEAAAKMLPLMAILFIPIWLSRGALYPWANPEIVAHDAIIQLKVAYLNDTGFTMRTIAYFIIWIIIARRVTSLSRQHDASTDPAIVAKLNRAAAPSLVVYALTVTFASFDWGMSLEPHWFSTIYGVIFAAGGALAAMSLAIVVLSRLVHREPFASFVKPETVGDLGNLSLAITMFWTYVSLSQFLIVWAGHLPEETPWYFVRMHNGWEINGFALLGLQFGLTFLLLIIRDRKRNIQRLQRVALWILAMRFLDLLWLIVPAFSDKLRVQVSDVAALAGIGGVWFWFYLRALASAPLIPVALRRAELAAGGDHHG
ncbi:MAG: hypothetical protein O3B24_04685 [Verrucomicrobia bacterium]|nr:hypothetical protein [Verrucomicrobiota bacterium]